MARKGNVKEFTTGEKVKNYEILSPVFEAIFREVKELSKKKQDGVLNKLKVDMINKILEQLKGVLSNEPTVQFLELLDNETLPTNSDAVLMLSQFEAAMAQFKAKYYQYDDLHGWKWFTK